MIFGQTAFSVQSDLDLHCPQKKVGGTRLAALRITDRQASQRADRQTDSNQTDGQQRDRRTGRQLLALPLN